MNEFLYLVVGLAFGAGASHLFTTMHAIYRRKPRVIAARAALRELLDHVRLPQAQIGAMDTVARYIADDYVSTHTQDEMRIEIGALPERAP